ncbi:MAG TPA: hypothetical protein VMU49_09710 [Candidatus Acidoferrales bacterium]|nr:hypothetical protein [Candidatus Acidoferrales bacterium]
MAWEAAGYICSERLQPFLPDLIPLLKRHRQLDIDETTETLLVTASVSTVERNVAQLRRGLVSRKMSQTKPGSLLRKQIPVIVGHWKEIDKPGYLEVDLVSHSGEFAVEEWIWTLCATDLSTGWTERLPVMGRGRIAVVAALDRIYGQLPFPLLGIHPDNGSEFINYHLVKYCGGDAEGGRPPIILSRSRPHHKNDNAHVEQKNWTLVRRLIGYQRLDILEQLAWLDALYTELLRPYNNCFQPVMKLIDKESAGQRPRKIYDRPISPLKRVLNSGAADPNKIGDLIELYTAVSPLTLKRKIDRRLAAMPSALEVKASA